VEPVRVEPSREEKAVSHVEREDTKMVEVVTRGPVKEE